MPGFVTLFLRNTEMETLEETGRQRTVLQTALNKVLQQSPTKIADIALDSLADVSTDMSAKYRRVWY